MEKQFGNFDNKDAFIQEVKEYLLRHDCKEIYEHSLNVAHVAERLCKQYNIDANEGFIAGMLHDIGGVYPNNKRLEVAKEMNLDLFNEEIELPMIIHQKISTILAEQQFGITKHSILDAIQCHSTLRKNYTVIDLVLFLADKIEWDQQGTPPYLEKLLKQLESSLEEAALYYINYIINNNIKVFHPWLVEGKSQLENKIKKEEFLLKN